MSLVPGTRLGPYEIVALIGAGGMGEVYRARDRRLARDVAIKMVATDRSDTGLLARLEQEARTAASLNHPNIVAVFDVGTHDGSPYVVSELLDGHTLRERLAAGPLPIRKAVEYAGSLAEALAAAHSGGIVHRDLKPENIFITSEGRPKILDFGLAKTAHEAPALASGAATALQTLPGVVMGTAGYMSPEQAAGRLVDHRTDIFSLGAVLGEMVTGQRTFKRPTAAETMAAIIQDDPPPASSLNPAVPATLDRIIQRCLEKSPAARFQSASDLAFALSTVASSGSHGVQPRLSTGKRFPFLQTAVVAAVAASAGALAAWFAATARTPGHTPAVTRHFTIDTRPAPISESNMPLAISPDGTKLVVSIGSFQGAQLYLRSLDRPDLQLIPGTLDAFNPFFSPNGEWVGFFSTMDVKKAPVAGGPVVTICHASNLIRGSATWGANDTIYFTPYSQSAGGVGNGVFSVPAAGGEPTRVTALASGEAAHRDPTLLPGDRAILFTVIYGDVTGQSGANFQRGSRIVARSLDTGEQHTVVEGAGFARYLPTGHLLYMKPGAQSDTMLAAPFDLRRLTLAGTPIVVSDQIASGDGYSAQLSVSQDGTLSYLGRAAIDVRSLVWVDRRGNAELLPFGQRSFDTPRLSPDGTRIAALVREKGQADVWVQERSGTLGRLTFDGVQTGLIWTPSGHAITFSTLVDGKGAIVSQDVDGDRASHVVRAAPRGLWPGSWSRDGQTLAFMESGNAGDVNLLRTGDTTPTPFVNSAATEWGARLSPDDRWMAYTSNESGRWEVYVKPYPGPGARRQISTGGGAEVVWARNGQELFYRNGTTLMGVEIQTTPAFSIGTPHPVVEGAFAMGQPGLPGYDVSMDGQRFLMVKVGDAEAQQRPIHIVLNWFDELRRLIAAAR